MWYIYWWCIICGKTLWANTRISLVVLLWTFLTNTRLGVLRALFRRTIFFAHLWYGLYLFYSFVKLLLFSNRLVWLKTKAIHDSQRRNISISLNSLCLNHLNSKLFSFSESLILYPWWVRFSFSFKKWNIWIGFGLYRSWTLRRLICIE